MSPILLVGVSTRKNMRLDDSKTYKPINIGSYLTGVSKILYLIKINQQNEETKKQRWKTVRADSGYFFIFVSEILKLKNISETFWFVMTFLAFIHQHPSIIHRTRKWYLSLLPPLPAPNFSLHDPFIHPPQAKCDDQKRSHLHVSTSDHQVTNNFPSPFSLHCIQ